MKSIYPYVKIKPYPYILRALCKFVENRLVEFGIILAYFINLDYTWLYKTIDFIFSNGLIILQAYLITRILTD